MWLGVLVDHKVAVGANSVGEYMVDINVSVFSIQCTLRSGTCR